MFKEDLLENHQKLKLNILKLIYLNNNNLSKQDLCNFFNISLPTLNVYLDDIEFFLNNIGIKTQIIFSKNFISLNFDTYLNFDILILRLLENSKKFKILKYLFEKNSLNLSYNKICIDLNISKSTLNRTLIECNKLLKEFDICIRNLNFEGSEIQIIYFFYSLFINTKFINTKNILFDKFINFLDKDFKIYLNLKQKYLINILFYTIKNRIKFLKKDLNLSKFHQENFKILKKNIFFDILNDFFKKNYSNENNENLEEILSYITICFMLSFNILNLNFIDKNINFKAMKPYISYNLIIYEIKKFYNYSLNSNYILNINILNLSFRCYFFKGIFYSNCYIIIKYYFEKYSNKSRLIFIENLLIKIENLNIYKHINYNYCYYIYIIILSNIHYDTKNEINVGVLSFDEELLLKSKIKFLKNHLMKKFNINIEEYNENNTYDLIISNLNENFINIPKNYKEIYFFTELFGDNDLTNITNLLDKIYESNI